MGDRAFRGLDRFNAPQDIPPGYLFTADNLYPDAGRMRLRPGRRALWTAARATALQCLTPVIRPDTGATDLWFAEGAGLFRHVDAATVAVAVALPGGKTLTAANVRICPAAKYVYVADDNSVNGLMRFPPDGGIGGEVVTGLLVPNKPTSAALTRLPLIAEPGRLAWAIHDAASPNVNLLTTQPTSSANVDTTGTKYWTTNKPGLSFNAALEPGNTFVNLTESNAYIETTASLETVVGTDGTYPSRFDVRFRARTEPPVVSNEQSIAVVTVTYYGNVGGTGTPLGTQTKYLGVMTYETALFSATFDAAAAGVAADIRSCRLRVGTSVEFNNINDPIAHTFSFSAAGGGFDVPTVAAPGAPTTLTVRAGTVLRQDGGGEVSGGAIATAVPVPQEPSYLTRGRRFWTQFAGPQNYSDTQTIAAADVTLQFPIPAGHPGVPVRLFLENATPKRAYSPAVRLTTGSATAIVFDITTIDPAIRSAATRLGLEFVEDTPVGGAAGDYIAAATDQTILLTIAAFTKPGNLTPGKTVRYRLEEWNAATDPASLLNVIRSDGSAFSPDITPTKTDAVGVVTLPLPKTNGTATHLALYRDGDFDDALGRLLAVLPYTGTDFAYGDLTVQAPYAGAQKNPHVAADYEAGDGGTLSAKITVSDNTPASFLLTRETYKGGRDAPPAKIREIVSWNGRLWLIAGEGRRSELWGSWLLSDDTNAGLYFSRVNLPNDPALAVKGFYTHIGDEDGDKALRLIPLDDRLIILFGRKAPYVLTGDDPSNFRLTPSTGEESGALGLVARDAAATFGSQIRYLPPVGVVAWDGRTAFARDVAESDQLISERVRALVTPARAGLTAYSPAALALSAIWAQGGRLYVTMPGAPADLTPTTLLVFDPNERNGSGNGVSATWSRWTCGNLTGGVSVPVAGDVAAHIVAGRDGMLYRFIQNTGDTATLLGAETAIPFSLATRRYGNQEGEEPFRDKRPYSFFAEVAHKNAAALSMSLSLTGRKATDIWSQAWALAGGDEERQEISASPGYIQSDTMFAGISGSSVRDVEIDAVRVDCSLGSERY